MEIYLLPLTDIKTRHNKLFGSKALNLGVIARDIETASGFAISTDLYKKVMSNNGDLHKVINLAESCADKSLSEIDLISKQIKDIIMATDLPVEFYDMIAQQYHKLWQDNVKVAVRSSATAEDLPDASFAGQLDSYLNISGMDNIIHAVKECWASLYTCRAIHYRSKKGICEKHVAMAVIIQEMIPATVSGVAFSANPITSNRREIYVEAVTGLGEGLVSGEKSGDIYLVNKDNLIVNISKTIDSSPLLTEYHIKLIAAAAKKLELLYGDYQDIEWAFYKGQVYILQTRPITTLSLEEPATIDPLKLTPIAYDVWVNVNERFPNPIMPIDGIVAKMYYQSLFSAYKSLGYYVPNVEWDKIDQGLFPEYFVPPAIKEKWNTKFKLFGKDLDIKKDWQDNEKVFNRYVKLLQDPQLETFPLEVIMEYIDDALRDFQRALYVRYLIYIQYSNKYNKLQKQIENKYGSKGKEALNFLIGGEDQITTRLNKELTALAYDAKKYDGLMDVIANSDLSDIREKIGVVATDYLKEFDLFMDKYGGREIDQGLGGLASRTWRDDPDVVWGMIKGMLKSDDVDKLSDDECINLADKIMADDKMALFIADSKRYNAFRENSHFYLTEAMSVFSGLFNHMGKLLAKKGYLDEADDIVYLTFFELKDILYAIYSQQQVSALELAEIITSRKVRQIERVEKWQRIKDDISLIGDYNITGEIQGIAVSTGTVKGSVRFINTPDDFHLLEPGDIMVASNTNPSWTPVFSYIGGLVLEYGGVLSHAAIIAREYRIPAVTGVVGIGSVLKDGDTIILNGTNGKIVICD